MNRIIYNDENGNLAIIIPTAEALEHHTIVEIAEKDVPAGVPYKIVSIDDIPTDRTFRAAWEVSSDQLTDGVGGDYTVFKDNPSHPDYVPPVDFAEAEDKPVEPQYDLTLRENEGDEE